MPRAKRGRVYMATEERMESPITIEQLKEMCTDPMHLPWVWIECLTPFDYKERCQISAYYQAQVDYCSNGTVFPCGYPNRNYVFDYCEYGREWLPFIQRPNAATQKALAAGELTYVTRCGNCTHWEPTGSYGGNTIEDMEPLGGCEYATTCMRARDFCSHGAPKPPAEGKTEE